MDRPERAGREQPRHLRPRVRLDETEVRKAARDGSPVGLADEFLAALKGDVAHMRKPSGVFDGESTQAGAELQLERAFGAEDLGPIRRDGASDELLANWVR